MSEQEDRERLRYLQLKAKAGQLTPSEPAIDQTTPQVTPQEELGTPRLFGLPETAERAVFPTSGVSAQGEKARKITQAPLQAFEALEAPTRFLGKTRGFAASDPKSALFRPEIEKVKGAVDKLDLAPKEAPKQQFTGADVMDVRGTRVRPEKTAEEIGEERKDVLKGGAELAGIVLSDPTILLGIAKSGTKKLIPKSLRKKSVGEITEETGKGFLRGGAKIKDATAKRAAKDVDEGVKKIIDNVSKHDVQSPTGGFGGIAKNAQSKIDAKMIEVDNILNDVVRTNPNAKVNLDNVVEGLVKDLKDGNISGIPLDEIDNAVKIVENQKEVLKRFKNLEGDLDLLQANEAKKAIGKKVFKKGAASLTDDPTKDAVKEILNLRIRDEMAQYAPKAAELNKDVSELILVKRAMKEAEKRASNRDFLDLTNKIAAGGAGLSALNQNPEAAIAAMTFIGLRKGLSKGRGASALITAGKGLQKLPSLPDIPISTTGAPTVGRVGRELDEELEKRPIFKR